MLTHIKIISLLLWDFCYPLLSCQLKQEKSCLRDPEIKMTFTAKLVVCTFIDSFDFDCLFVWLVCKPDSFDFKECICYVQ
jgi:hypothetical protein